MPILCSNHYETNVRWEYDLYRHGDDPKGHIDVRNRREFTFAYNSHFHFLYLWLFYKFV